MPIYEYACSGCGNHFEKLVRRFAEPVSCPACTSAAVDKQLSVFAVGAGTTASESLTLVSAPAASATVPVAGIDYTIQSGDTLGIIGARYGLGWEVLAAANGLDAYSILEVGQVIRVPGAQETVAAAATTAPSSPAVPVAAATNRATASVSTSGSVATTPAVPGTSYTVIEGDTLLDIALRNNVSVDEIVTASGLSDSNMIRIGQVLTIPGRVASSTAALPAPTPAPGTVKVVTGQGTIAITVPATATVTAPTVAGQGTVTTTATAVASQAVISGTATAPARARVYTVVSGDTISSIALVNNMTWQELLTLNGLTEDSILQIGQEIRLD
jgi:putative FmdB family regulatory protein